MDYIREELLRQQVLLAALLTGGAPRSGEELTGGEQRAVFPSREEAEAAGIAPGGTEASTAPHRSSWVWEDQTPEAAALWVALTAPAAWVNGHVRAPETDAEGFVGSFRELTALSAAGIKSTDTGTTAEPSPGAERAPAGAAGIAGRTTAGVASAVTDGAQIRLVTELRQSEGAAPSGAAALSRAFQRDARRYDGGFRLY